MNEPANFCDGYCDGEAPKRATSGAFDPNYPPYAINNRNCRYEFSLRARVCTVAHRLPLSARRMPLWSHTVPQDLKLYNTIGTGNTHTHTHTTHIDTHDTAVF